MKEDEAGRQLEEKKYALYCCENHSLISSSPHLGVLRRLLLTSDPHNLYAHLLHLLGRANAASLDSLEGQVVIR